MDKQGKKMTKLQSKIITSSIAILLCSNLFAQETYTIKDMSLKQALEKISKESKLSYIVDENLIEGKNAANITATQAIIGLRVFSTNLIFFAPSWALLLRVCE